MSDNKGKIPISIMAHEPTGKRHCKRYGTYGEPPVKKPALAIMVGTSYKWNLQALANIADAVESGAKSAVSALNELGVNVTYNILRQGGPAHCPSFTVEVLVADMSFEGWGHSKREARASAAKACLSALLARAGRVLPVDRSSDFTADISEGFPISDFQCLESNAITMQRANIQPSNGNNAEGTATETMSPTLAQPQGYYNVPVPRPSTVNKSPINWLYENYPGVTFVCSFGDGSPLLGPVAPLQLSHSMRFKVVCAIQEKTFEGFGSSKKLAKLAAARTALAALEGAGDVTGAILQPADDLPLHIADHIAKLVNEKFNELVKNDLAHSKRKVLAGIVQTIDDNNETATVIAVTTGTKCVSGEHMSVRGRAVNDSHAEVAARRCLQRYLYNQLFMYVASDEHPDPHMPNPASILEPVKGGGYAVKPNVKFHLYVSTAPCGDGRIFSPHEQDLNVDKHPNRQARGQLRTKIESGEGTIPVKNSNNVQTWDGVMQGERLLTMSCSDKVARWCVSGLQGALLSMFLRPVYLDSLVLGSLLHPHHMHRALCGRIEGHITSLPSPFRLHRPNLARAASIEARTPARAPSFSLVWSCTSPNPEILNAMTGKLENGHPSLLCKQTMFSRWQFLMKRLPRLQQEARELVPVPIPANCENLLYSEAKQLCPAYQAAKNKLFEAFDKAKLGKWIRKPLEQDQFVCEIMSPDPKHLFT